MKSSLTSPVLTVALTLVLFSACASTHTAPSPAVDPHTDPTIIGAVDSAVAEAANEAAVDAAPATTGRRVGAVVGVFAAIFGSESEPINKSIDRYRRFRDAGETIGTLVGVRDAATRGWQRGLAFDLQMAELKKLDGLDVTRPTPDQIDVRFSGPDAPPLHDLACTLATAQPGSITVEAPGDMAFAMREQLIDQGLAPTSVNAQRNDDLAGAVLHLRMQY
jgi:hypothetical protein